MRSRRWVLTGAVAAPLIGVLSRGAFAAREIKISHQFPAGTEQDGDFRDRLCRKFGRELERRSNGAFTVNVYPNSSLMKSSGTSPPA